MRHFVKATSLTFSVCQEIFLIHVVEMQEVTKINKEVEVALDSNYFWMNLVMYSLTR